MARACRSQDSRQPKFWVYAELSNHDGRRCSLADRPESSALSVQIGSAIGTEISRLPSLAEILRIIPDGVLVLDQNAGIVLANERATSIFGYLASELAGKHLSVLIPRHLRERHHAHYSNYHGTGQGRAMTDRPVQLGLHCDGREIPLSISICNLNTEVGVFSVAIVRDALKFQLQLRFAEEQATQDPLTGMGNRRFLSDAVANLIQQQNSEFSVLYIDLCRFKQLNDQYGHDAGDNVLKVLSQRLRKSIRSRDLLARIGGDEFVVVLHGFHDRARLVKRLEELVIRICMPTKIADTEFVINVSIGVAHYPTDGLDLQTLLTIADNNMYEAKRATLPYRLPSPSTTAYQS
jgi:diguanylate cyclase (GGDEF)-like protein/PAS domain S-box-containing protein